MGKAYLIVEGHGEVGAARNLVIRLWADLGLRHAVWGAPKRGKALNTRAGVLQACELLRSERDCSLALLLRDEDDGCPATAGPETAAWVTAASLPFPAAVVLAHREFEAWFLPCIHLMAGREIRPGVRIAEGTTCPENPESIRDVKGWLSERFPPGKTYKPTLDQLRLTQWIDFGVLRASQARSFRTLENALRFLAAPGALGVYPPPRP
ncbi:hypothetical protein BE04_45880 [Sorangium cellulosum]|nr:DUF4276 family protein [Sorangium cellulosum]AGP37584.1 hypothetical protein SCE1572_25665 [Sorangium cellulosum So0157-2]KYF51871.1 hypothetical protein BE04_45880 [Sorangium cellulosum]